MYIFLRHCWPIYIIRTVWLSNQFSELKEVCWGQGGECVLDGTEIPGFDVSVLALIESGGISSLRILVGVNRD